MIDLTKPYEEKRIRKDKKGNYLMNKAYLHALASLIKKRLSKYHCLAQYDKGNDPEILVYGFLRKEHFYLLACIGDSFDDFLKKNKDIRSQEMLMLSSLEYHLVRDQVYHGKSMHPKIDKIVKELDKSQRANAFRYEIPPKKKHYYHVLDNNDYFDNFDGMEFDSLKKAKAWIHKHNVDHHDYYIATEYDRVFNPLGNGYDIKNEQSYNG